jgi:hypothetical protein
MWKILNCRCSVWSLNHLYRIPPFKLWREVGGHLGKWHRQEKGEETFGFSPLSFAFMDYILHMSFHIRKQGITLDMPIAAIACNKLFVHLVRHCFRPKCFYLYK